MAGEPGVPLSADATYDEKKLMLHKVDSLSLLLFTFLLTLTVVTIWIFKHRRVAFIHSSGLAIIYGLVIGAIIRYGVHDEVQLSTIPVKPEFISNLTDLLNKSERPDQLTLKVGLDVSPEFQNKTWTYAFKGESTNSHSQSDIDEKATFDPEIFFNVLLPPIIFHAGYSMKKKYFFRNIGSIFTFAFIGTAISTFTVGGFMYGVTSMVPSLRNISFIDNLHFGALISATDPVTVLTIFNDLNVDVNLYALVFGESVLNDAVAICFVEALKDFEESVNGGCKTLAICEYNAWHLVKAILDFFGIFSASFLVGSLMGCITALLTKFTHIRQHPLLESTLFVLMSYSTFLLAEVFELTGIVAVLFCGITQAHYTYNNLSTESKISTKNFFDLLNFMAENFIFSYIGVSMFTFPKHNFNPYYIFGSFFAIFLGRLLNIYPLSAILNLGRTVKISGNIQHTMMFSGLRGAIAFALAIRNTVTESRQMILSATLLIVIVTVIINGGSTMSVLGWLGVPTGVLEDPGEHDPIVNSPLHGYHTVDESSGTPSRPNLRTQQSKPEKSWLAQQWAGIDAKFFKPLLTHASPSLMETMPNRCLPLGRVFTSREQREKHPLMQKSAEPSTDDLESGAFSSVQGEQSNSGTVEENKSVQGHF